MGDGPGMDQGTEIVAARSGRPIEFRQYGDPGGHPAFFFHGLIGSHHQAAYVAADAGRLGLRLIAPNRPGVGGSGFVRRASALEVVGDVEDLARALGIDGGFSLIGISGGTPYALATLLRLGGRVRSTTILSGMGPLGLPGALRGMARSNRAVLELGARAPWLARRGFRRVEARFRADPVRALDRFIAGSSRPDRALFRRDDLPLRALFLEDLRAVFETGHAPDGLAAELAIYRRFGFRLRDLPADRPVTLWQGLDDDVVPPPMALAMARRLPEAEVHFVPGGHFVAAAIAGRIIAEVRARIDAAEAGAGRTSTGRVVS